MTQEQLTKIAPKLPLSYEVVKNGLDKYEINTVPRIAGFFSQLAHESCDFTRKIENLNYSAQGLMKTWPNHFKTIEVANEYARKPEKIANKVYGNHKYLGNNGEASGDGYKFRGRGYVQLTGRANYTEFSKAIEKDLEETIKYLETDEGALEAALFFWKKAKCNSFCDKEDIKGLTKSINGGFNGLEDRQAKYSKYKAILLT